MEVNFSVIMRPMLDINKEDFSLIGSEDTVGGCCGFCGGFGLGGAVPFRKPVAAMEVYVGYLYGDWDFFPVQEDVEQISPE